MDGDKPAKKRFKAYPIGYFHIDLAEVRTEEGKLHLFVAIDRTSKFAFARLEDKANRVTATAFLEALIEITPYKIHTVLTDNGVQFCHQPSRRNGPTARYFRHMVDMHCQENGIEHRLTKPNHPWSDEDQKTVWETVFLRNGQVERMNRTLKDATVKRYHDETQEQLKPHLQLFLDAYNHAKRLKTPKGLTPYEFICKTWTEEPKRFIVNPAHYTLGLNI